RMERLRELQVELETNIHIEYMDVTELQNAMDQLDQLIIKMGGLDLIVLNAGVSYYGKEWVGRETDLDVVDVNIRGFANLAGYSFAKFEEQGHGQLIGISSIASFFGWGLNIPYNASKAFINVYLQGYRQRANHSDADISVTTIVPGYVDSEMTEDKKGLFWLAPAKEAARQIANAIEQKKNWAYITKRWRFIGWLVKLIPNWFWDRM
ncbi:MAG: SDR family NAD(P)-dependent oxidoreductase, partial [Balneolaceae bacterium]